MPFQIEPVQQPGDISLCFCLFMSFRVPPFFGFRGKSVPILAAGLQVSICLLLLFTLLFAMMVWIENRAGSTHYVSIGCQDSVPQQDTKRDQHRQHSRLLMNRNTSFCQSNCFPLPSPNLPASRKKKAKRGETRASERQGEENNVEQAVQQIICLGEKNEN